MDTNRTVTIRTFVLALLITLSPSLASGESLRISWEPYPPYEYIENGTLKGTSTDLINEVCKRLNITPVYIEQPFTRALSDIRTGHVDAVYCLISKPDRKEYLFYPNEIIGEAIAGIMSRDDTQIKFNSNRDLKEFTIGVVRGYSYGKTFDNLKLNKMVVGDNTHLLKLLDNRRVDLVVGDYNVLAHLHEEAHYSWGLDFLLETNRSPYYIAFSKQMGQRGKDITQAFDRELRQIKAEKAHQMQRANQPPSE